MAEDSKTIKPYENNSLKVDNGVILAARKASLIEEKLLLLSIMNVKKNEKKELVSEIPAAIIRKRFDIKGGSFYETLLRTALLMSSRQYVIQNEKGFKIYNILRNAEYIKDSSTFRVRWEDELEPNLLQVTSNYTCLSPELMFSWRSVYSFRLYSILKRFAFYGKEYCGTRSNIFCHEFSLAELKFELGVISTKEDRVRAVLLTDSCAVTPNYERAAEITEEKTYDEWRDFKRVVIDKAVNEINQKANAGECDLSITYEPIKAGSGGKVRGIRFTFSLINKPEGKKVEKSENSSVVNDLSDDEKFQFYLDMRDIISEPLKVSELQVLAEDAGWDLSKISKAYKCAQNSPHDNLVPYMRSAIKGNWEPNERVEKPNENKNVVYKADNEEGTYNGMSFDDIQRQLLAKHRKTSEQNSEV